MEVLLKMLYFAYGSNMESTQMQSRCPGYIVLGAARLTNYTLVFTRWSRSWNSGTADILPDRGKETWGVLYDLSLDDLRRVDRFADYPNSYLRHDLVVELDGSALAATTYVAVRQGVFAPSRAYLGKMIEGATGHNLPESYIACLRAITTHD